MSAEAGTRTAILILGMHRAGTSAITRLINLLGAELGEELLPSGPDNQKGFWENRKIVEFHQDLLKQLGSDWDDIRPIDPAWFESQEGIAAADKLTSLIAEVFADAPLFAVKDPRACRFVPLWRSALGTLNISMTVLLPWRPVGEVAKSLAARNGMPPLHSGLLWLRHIVEAERETRDLPRLTLPFDAVLMDWQKIAGRIARTLKVKWPVSSKQIAAEAGAFLDPKARHHHEETFDVEALAQITQDLQRALGQPRRAALSKAVDLAERATAALFENTAPFVGRLIADRWQAEDALEATKRVLSADIDKAINARDEAHAAMAEFRSAYEAESIIRKEKEETIDAALVAIDAANTQLDQAKEGVAVWQREAERLEKAVVDIRQHYEAELDHRQTALEHYQGEYASAIRQRDALHQELQEIQNRLDSALAQNALAEERRLEIRALERRLETHQAKDRARADQIEALRLALERESKGHASERAARLAAEKSLSEVRSESAHLSEEVRDAHAALQRIDGHLGDTRQLLFTTRARLREAERDRDLLALQKTQITQTLSWQFTKPLRVAFRLFARAVRPFARIARDRAHHMHLIPISGVVRTSDGLHMEGPEAKFRAIAGTLSQPNGWCWVQPSGPDALKDLAASLFIPPTQPGQPTGWHPLLWSPARTPVRLPDNYIELDLLVNGPNLNLQDLRLDIREVGKLNLMAVAAVRAKRRIGLRNTVIQMAAQVLKLRLASWVVNELGEQDKGSPKLDYSAWIQSFDTPTPADLSVLSETTRQKVLVVLDEEPVAALEQDIQGQVAVNAVVRTALPIADWEKTARDTGASIVFHLEPNCRLRPFTLAKMASALSQPVDKEHPRLAVFADHDVLDANGRRKEPFFKPCFDRDAFEETDYTGPVHGFSAVALRDTDATQVHELMSAIGEDQGEGTIHRIPGILSHRTGKPSPSARTHAKAPAMPKPEPLVSLIIPTRDQADLLSACVTSIQTLSAYRNFEIIVVDNNSEKPETHALFEALTTAPNVSVLPYPHPFNYSGINNFAVRRSRGEIIGLINNDVEAMNGEWLGEMVRHAARKDVGAVGALLFYGDDTVQHAGVICGPRGVAAHRGVGLSEVALAATPMGMVTRQQSCVTAACLLTRQDVWQEVEGLDAINLAVAFNDVDYCLKAREAGYKVIWTPNARLYHHESKSRGRDDENLQKAARFEREVVFMRERWGKILDKDPFYNPNLTIGGTDSNLAFPPRAPRAWDLASSD